MFEFLKALWAISNIAGDGAKCRDEVIARGAVQILVELGKRMNSLKYTFVRTIAWFIVNLCRYKPLPSYDVLVQLSPLIFALLKYDVWLELEGIRQFIYLSQDMECKIDTCWAVVHLTSGPYEKIPLTLVFIPDIVLFIKSSERKLILPALRVLENFTKVRIIYNFICFYIYGMKFEQKNFA